MALCIVLSMSLPASAKNSSENYNTVKVNATINATQIDCTVTASIKARATGADSSDPLKLSYDNLEITNNMKVGKLKVTSLTATGNSQWTVVADTAKTWEDLPADAHFISIKATNGDTVKSIDLSGTGVTQTIYISSGDKTTYTFSGHTGAVSDAISEADNLTVANIVATVELY